VWSNTRRGAQFLDGTVPRLVRAITELTEVLKEAQVQKPAEDEDEIARRVLCEALDACGGRSIGIAEVIDDLERIIENKAHHRPAVEQWRGEGTDGK